MDKKKGIIKSLWVFLFLLFNAQAYAVTITISGSLYSDEGITPITSADQTVHLVIYGVSIGTDVIDSSGNYSITATITAENPYYLPLLVYVDNGSVKGTTVTQMDSVLSNTLTNFDIYASHLIIRQDGSSAPLDTGDMHNAKGSLSDPDILYTITWPDTYVVGTNSKLYIANGYIYEPAGDITTHHIQIEGTFNAGSNNIYVNGDWDFGTGTFNRDTSTVHFTGTNNQRVVSSGDPFYNLTLNNTGGVNNNILEQVGSLTVNNQLTVSNGKLNTTTNNYSITVAGHFDQSSPTGEVEANASTITVGGDFSADGTLDMSNYNNASLVLTGTGSLSYANLSSPWSNGFYNLTVGQSGNTTTQTSLRMAVRNVLTLGSGELASPTNYLYLNGNNPLVFDTNSTLSIYAINFFGANQTIPTLTNGYDSNVWLGRGNTAVTQTGPITLNSGQTLRIDGDNFIDRAVTYQTNGFDLNVGGFILLGSSSGGDTALKTFDMSGSMVTVKNDFEIRTGTNSLISTNSELILNGTAAQFVTTNGKAFDKLTITNPSVSGVTFNDGLTANTLTNTTPNSKLTFTSGETYTINSAVNLQGASGQPVTLEPTINGSRWNFVVNAGATKTLDHLAVSWSDASGTHSTQKPMNPSNSVRTGSNIDWFPTLLGVTKSSVLISDPINGTGSGKNHIPGAIVEYSIVVQNSGNYSADANTVTIYDVLDANVEFDVSTGVVFSDGSNSSNLALGAISYSHTSSPTSYTYTPTGAFDPNVAGIRIET
ncbi:hypothetical protein MNBD_GAMMA04-1207, partial [hydrothermal vent metagenome]